MLWFGSRFDNLANNFILIGGEGGVAIFQGVGGYWMRCYTEIYLEEWIYLVCTLYQHLRNLPSIELRGSRAILISGTYTKQLAVIYWMNTKPSSLLCQEPFWYKTPSQNEEIKKKWKRRKEWYLIQNFVVRLG